jgi:outer membrane protein assembly factor BamB
MSWGVTKLRRRNGSLEKQWTTMSTWKPAPDDGTGWEPVFHPAVTATHLYMPGAGGMVMKVDRQSGEVVDCLTPFDDEEPNRYITSPLTIDGQGYIYYTVMKLDPSAPWSRDVVEADLVKAEPGGKAWKVSFARLGGELAAGECVGTFAREPLPWPPSPDAQPPSGPCGSQRPGLNAAPAVGSDGTVYVIGRAHFNAAYGFLAAVNPDLTPRWSASLRDRLRDGCDVLLPPSGMMGGCREGSRRGVDPATNDLPAGRVEDRSTASPTVAPDGSVLYGAYTRYNYRRGHLFRFSGNGEFLGSYDYGWDITPAIFAHDGTWSVIVKDNGYAVGSYCDVLGYCGQAEAKFRMTSLTAELRPEWSYQNTNDQACDRLADGRVVCEAHSEGFDWCVNMVAVDRNGVVLANSEDGNVYAIDRTGRMVGQLFLKKALGAAYTPLSIGEDGAIYTQNNGTLFVVGEVGR